MIDIRVYRQEGSIIGYDVRGHSAMADSGYDIVCAGVSALTQTALLGLGNHLHRALDYRISSGDLHTRLIEAPDEQTNAILETMLLGLREISALSPHAVQIQEITV